MFLRFYKYMAMIFNFGVIYRSMTAMHRMQTKRYSRNRLLSILIKEKRMFVYLDNNLIDF